MAGLAPSPFCGMLLADLGARIIRVDRPNTNTFPTDRFTRGKEALAVDLRDVRGQSIFRKLCASSDVIIDSFRPGVMEKLNLGPADVLAVCPRLIYARMSGFGQTGPFSGKAGHDINFLALSGVLSMLGPQDGKPTPPLNLLGDFGGGLLCAFGILAAVIRRGITGRGEVLDANLTDGTAYLSSWLWRARDLPVWGEGRGTGWFDGGLPWYTTYRCRDGQFVAVGCLEKQFFDNLLEALGIPGKYNQQHDQDYLESMRTEFGSIFQGKTRGEWAEIFEELDACVTPVLSLDEASRFSRHQSGQPSQRGQTDNSGRWSSGPSPSPRILSPSNLPLPVAELGMDLVHHGQHTEAVLREMGHSDREIQDLISGKIIQGPP
ncbi:Alpha-methylacyl-CoA racemase [Hypsibius exemplaris]|uniref:Alpha-methylacyl-CoA racemase n=1 Tax=Hypsibius exemplaris TaxID=2072580 RepID=A0A1W0WY27_HYPEX|nr:Alpha-methylacyl-CoA racemase [Hypsibius exemplaris]